MSHVTSTALNVLGRTLQPCSFEPRTGYFRDGCCHTDPSDRGLHTICVVVTQAFLAYSMRRGNDLSTPRPEYDFPGLKPGDRWCLCAARWLEAWHAKCAPEVLLESTHLNSLGVVSLDQLKAHAAQTPA
jgi:hypothetical protein